MEIIEVCEAVILNDKKQILLQLRDDKPGLPGSGKWNVLGGGKEAGEEARDGLVREIKEEIGLDLEPILITTTDDSDGLKIYRHHIYLAYYAGRAEDLLLREGQMVKFFNLSEISALDKVAWFERVYASIIKNKFLS